MENHPSDWPPQSTGAGLMLRLVHALGRPGRPRRAAVMLLAVLLVPVVIVLVMVLGS